MLVSTLCARNSFISFHIAKDMNLSKTESLFLCSVK